MDRTTSVRRRGVSPPGAAARVFAPLADSPGFRALWGSSLLFFSGFWGQSVVLAWLAFELTASPFAVAAFTAVSFAPLLLGPFGGALSDRTDRVRLLIASQAIALADAAVIAVLAMMGLVEYWHVVVAGFVLGAMQAPLQPARFTLLMDLVGRDGLSKANALSTAAMMGARIVAPAAAGWMIGALGVSAALWFSAAWYLPSLYWAARLRELPGRSMAAGGTVLAEILDGVRVAVRRREIAGVLLVSIAANALAWPILQAFLPIFAEEVLRSGAAGLGLLFAVNACGSLAGALGIAALGDVRAKGPIFLAGTAAFGLLLCAFALSGGMPVALTLILLAGIASAGFGVMQSTILLLLAPDEVRGRVMGVLMLSIGVMPFATLAQGAVASAAGVIPTTIVSGALLAASVGAVALAIPGLRRSG